jgi:hypothetical protein
MPEPTGVEVEEVAAPVTDENLETGDTGVEPEVAAQETSEGVTQEADNAEAGRIAAIQAERERRQAVEARNKILEQELAQVKTRIPQNQPEDPFKGLKEEDLVDVQSVKGYVNRIKEDFTQRFDTFRINQSVKAARQSHKDYDEVVKILPQVANQTQLGYISASDDPAEMAYMFVKASPQYIQSLTQDTVTRTAQQTIDKINQHSKQVKTLSNSGGGQQKAESVIKNLSDSEMDKLEMAVRMGDENVIKKYFK